MQRSQFDKRAIVSKQSTRDTSLKQQAIHIQKALKETEEQPKMKHVRVIILTTFEKYSSNFFYDVAFTLPLYSHPVVCWKFLYLVNKLFRDGHDECVRDGLRNGSKILQIKSAWDNCSATFGYPLKEFFKFFANKLRLYRKYNLLSGSLEISPQTLQAFLSSAPDNLFQLSVDLMDTLEELLHFQDVVFKSVDSLGPEAYAFSGRCKLAPIQQCIQDGVALYELTLPILFRLHALLDSSTMSGHRDRFASLHASLKRFLDHTLRMRYFKPLVQIPTLPAQPPDFRVQSQLKRHQALKVTTNEWDCNDASEDGILPAGDTSPTSLQKLEIQPVHAPPVSMRNNTNPFVNDASMSEQEMQQNNNNTDIDKRHGIYGTRKSVVDDKYEFLIEVEMLKSEIDRLKFEHQDHSKSLLERIQTLEDEIKDVVQLNSKQEERYSVLESRLHEESGQAKVTEDKFAKLKAIYAKLREEHVTLLREFASTKHSLNTQTQLCEEMEQKLETLETNLAHAEHVKLANAEVQQNADDALQQLSMTKARLLDLEAEREKLVSGLEDLSSTRMQLQTKVHELEQSISRLEEEKINAIESCRAAEAQVAELDSCLKTENARSTKLETQLEQAPRLAIIERRDLLLTTVCRHGIQRVNKAIDIIGDDELFLSLRTTPEFLVLTIGRTVTSLDQLQAMLSEDDRSTSIHEVEFPLSILAFVFQLCDVLQHGRITFQVFSHLTDVPDVPTQLSQDTLEFLTHLKAGWPTSAQADRRLLLNEVAAIRQKLESLISACDQLRVQSKESELADQEQSANQMEKEIQSMLSVIAAAEARFKEFRQSRSAELTEQYNVNALIIDNCSTLLACVLRLVQQSKALQKEISGSSKSTEAYKRRNKWNQGLISAAKSVGAGVNFMVEVADRIITGEDEKLERLVVSSEEVAAATTQLYVASRVKAPIQSPLLADLQTTSRQMSEATGALIGCVRSAIDKREAQELDFSQLTLTQSKRAEVESQVRLLELKSQLEKERVHLAELRKKNYRDGAEMEQRKS